MSDSYYDRYYTAARRSGSTVSDPGSYRAKVVEARQQARTDYLRRVVHQNMNVSSTDKPRK
jgi:hypothetical protein